MSSSHEIVHQDRNGEPVPAAVFSLYQNIKLTIDKAYPGWVGTWNIQIDIDNGIVQILNPVLSGKMGFLLHIVKIDPEGNTVRAAIGEYFERYNVARGRGLSIATAIKDMKRNNFGEGLYDA